MTGTAWSRGPTRWLLAATGLLLLAWVVLPAGQLPLYDGLAFPDEPYRYVETPAGTEPTKAGPTTASVTVRLDSAGKSEVAARTGEKGPQALLALPRGALTAADGVRSVVVSLTPVAATEQPDTGKVFGNVYRVRASKPVTVAPPSDAQRPAIIQLREPYDDGYAPVLMVRAGGQWTALETVRYGVDVFGGQLTTMGDYALVQPSGPRKRTGTAPTSTGSGGGGVVLVVLAALLFAGTVVAVRRSRRPAASGGQGSEGQGSEGPAEALQGHEPEQPEQHD